MKSISSLKKSDLKNIKLVVFDVDGILVPRGTKISQSGGKTVFYIKKVDKKVISLIKKLTSLGFAVNINSGRSLDVLQRMFWPVLDNITVTYENGSSSWIKGKVYQHVNSYSKLSELYQELSAVKNKNIMGFEPKEFILTLHAKRRISTVESIVRRHKKVYFIWNGEAYDIGLNNVQTKLKGLSCLLKILNLKENNVLFIGDNYNDSPLAGNSGIIVSADKNRLKGDFFIKLSKKQLPGKVLMEHIIKLISPRG